MGTPKNNKIIILSFFLISIIPITLITGPAIPDISLILVSIFFIFYFLLNKIDKTEINFIYFTIIFWLVLIVLNFYSLNFYKSFTESLIFLRILLLPLIMFTWLLIDKKRIKIVLLIILIANLIVIVDCIYQFFNYFPLEGFKEGIIGRKPEIYGRLSGPFLDMVPGSYIAKFFIFGFLGLTFVINDKFYLNILSIIYITLCGYITFISGERMALATFILGIILSILVLRKHRIIFVISILCFIFSSYLTYKFHDNYKNFKILESNPNHLGLKIEKFDKNCVNAEECSRIINLQPSFFKVISNFDKSAYYDAYSLAISMINKNPVSGIGMNNFYYGCKNIDEFKRDVCWSHPHNFYLQWLTENGLIGFIFFLIYIFYIFKLSIIKNRKFKIFDNYSIIPLAIIFWPIMSTGSLLKNWHGIETFFIIGLCLSLSHIRKVS
tara:strand:+ start:1218 stop:2534 length:1317 start_codon:yes stop_codon:yes gene_type:complete